MERNRRLLLIGGIHALVLVVAGVLVATGGDLSLAGTAGEQEECWDLYLERWGPCPEEEEEPPDEDEGEPAVPGCGLWQPDVGDAFENGLITTDADPPVTILIAIDDQGGVVDRMTEPFVGTDTFSVPEQYRSEGYWFAVGDCGRWHSAQELGLLGECFCPCP